MTSEAEFEKTPAGLVPATPGWFTVNLDDAAWFANEQYGTGCMFEGKHRFAQVGIHVHVLMPGQPASLYHRESSEEDFLVLHGECTLIVQGEERPLSQWDFFHSPPGTEHVFVGAGDGPCAILMVGRRGPDQELHYPVNEVARRYGASADAPTDDPKTAYAGRGPLETTTAHELFRRPES